MIGVTIAQEKMQHKQHANQERTPPTSVPSNVSNVPQVRLLQLKKQLNVKSAPKAGFKKKKDKTSVINRKMEPSRQVVRHRWSYQKAGTVPIATRTTSVKNQNHARKAQRAAKIERAAFPVRRAPPVLRGPRHAFPAPKANLLR